MTAAGQTAVDVAIVGAGAAGLAAAIFAGEQAPAARIVVVDGARAIGAKILVSGGGRCNVTHVEVRPEDFHGPRHRIKHVLAAFSEQDTQRWFTGLGVALKREESGKLFPVTDRARTVLDALLRRCRELGITVLPEHRVLDLQVEADRFVLQHARGRLTASRVIMATGGRSLPRTGSDGEGWKLLGRLGHSVTPTYPALVPLRLAPEFFHAELMGLSHLVELTTRRQGTIVDRRSGSLLWTHFGVSGPVVLDASRFWTMAETEPSGGAVVLEANLLPGWTAETAETEWLARAGVRPRLGLAKLLAEWWPERLATALCRLVGVDPTLAVGQLRREPRRALAERATRLVLPVIAHRGWNFAEVTAGGVPLDEVDFRTMESRRRPGLYLVGELLDCDGRIGGFNFQWAWSTGYLAGRAAAAGLTAAGRARPRPTAEDAPAGCRPAAPAPRDQAG